MKAPHPAAFVHTPGAHRVPLTLLAATVAPTEGSEWASLEEMAAELGEDPVEGRIVAELDDQWRAAGGRFRGAIRVVDGAISNGCHRFGALWRLGADTVDVWVADDDHPDPTWADPKPAWEVTVRLTDGAFTDDDENFDRAVCAARSFPLANGWVDGDVAYARGAELSVSLYCDTGRAPAGRRGRRPARHLRGGGRARVGHPGRLTPARAAGTVGGVERSARWHPRRRSSTTRRPRRDPTSSSRSST